MAYRDNLSALAAQVGIPNPPDSGLPEEKLGIAKLTFVDKDGVETEVEATSMNKGARLYLQVLATPRAGTRVSELPFDEESLAGAAEFFAELWTTDIEKRLLLNSLRHAVLVKITWKGNDISR